MQRNRIHEKQALADHHELTLEEISHHSFYPYEITHSNLFEFTNYTKTKWMQSPGEPAKVTYGFATSVQHLTKLLLVNADEFINREAGLTDISHSRPLIATAFAAWEQSTNIRFAQVPGHDAEIPIFGFTENEGDDVSVLGFAYYPKHDADHQPAIYSKGMGFNVEHFGISSDASKLFTAMHEVGHAGLGLRHPFERLPDLNSRYHLKSFSIMNYEDEITPEGKTIYPITPMPFDIEAAQAQYGVNLASGVGDDVYRIIDLLPKISPENHLPIAALPWDNSGVDTLSAAGIHTNVVLDLTHYSRSETTNGYIVMPKIDIENVIGGHAGNYIILNSLDNHVDIRHATDKNQIVIDPTNCGHDIVFGFNLGRDKIFLHNPHNTHIARQISTPTLNHCATIGEDTLCYTSGTHIDFDDNNSVLVAHITDSPITIEPITLENIVYENREELKTAFANYPSEFVNDFAVALSHGLGMTFLTTLTENGMRVYGCKEAHIERIAQIMQALMALYRGTVISSSTALLTSVVMAKLGFSAQATNIASTVVSSGINALQNLSLFGVARMATSMAGNYAGSRFIFWAHSKAAAAIHRRNEALRQEAAKKEDAVLFTV